jgi:hypothetical protein
VDFRIESPAGHPFHDDAERRGIGGTNILRSFESHFQSLLIELIKLIKLIKLIRFIQLIGFIDEEINRSMDRIGRFNKVYSAIFMMKFDKRFEGN